MNEQKKEDGLPDISELTSRKNILAIIMVMVVLVSFLGVHFFPKNKTKLNKAVEETYVTSSNVQAEPNKTELAAEKTKQVTATPQSQVSPELIQQQVVLLQQKQKELQQRLAAPLMLVNANQTSVPTGAIQQNQTVSRDANTQFMNQVSAQTTEVATATTIGPLNTVVAQGNLIHATLESATNSDLPGHLRASVSEPVYSEDGTQVLVPEGSRLIGQYKSGMLQGQSRIFVVWTRLITSNGISVQLGSPGVDSLSVAGMSADEINRHFWERFGTASLLSLIGAGAANVGVKGQDQNNSAAIYREAVASSFAQSADQSLQQESQIAPTLKTYQGKPIMVFIAKDLHFANVMQQVKPKFNVF